MKNEKDPMNIPNVCFSLVDDTFNKKQQAKYKKQRIRRGFDDTELWCLDNAVIKFLLPRLHQFKKLTIGIPPVFTEEIWQQKLSDYIYACQLYIYDLDNAFITLHIKEGLSAEESDFVITQEYVLMMDTLEDMFKNFKYFWW